MTYTVIYSPDAVQELADLWLGAVNRTAVTDSANRIDRVLRTDPHQQGEARQGNIRVLVERPLVAQFEIHDEDCLVEVLRVRWIGN